MKNLRKHTLVFGSIALMMGFLFYFLEHKRRTRTERPSYRLQIHQKGDELWYYEIYGNSRLLIRQEYIPAVRGGQYFTSQSDAEKMGKLVITKLEAGRTPTITIDELQRYGIAFKE